MKNEVLFYKIVRAVIQIRTITLGSICLLNYTRKFSLNNGQKSRRYQNEEEARMYSIKNWERFP